jgi:hypothetical protein
LGGGGPPPLDSSLSAAALISHRFSIQSRVIRTIRHPVIRLTVRVKCLQHLGCGNAHQRTSLAAHFKLRSSEVRNRAFLMEMHPLTTQSTCKSGRLSLIALVLHVASGNTFRCRCSQSLFGAPNCNCNRLQILLEIQPVSDISLCGARSAQPQLVHYHTYCLMSGTAAVRAENNKLRGLAKKSVTFV